MVSADGKNTKIIGNVDKMKSMSKTLNPTKMKGLGKKMPKLPKTAGKNLSKMKPLSPSAKKQNDGKDIKDKKKKNKNLPIKEKTQNKVKGKEKQPNPDDQKYKKDISSRKVQETLGRINENLGGTIKDKKFMAGFQLAYPPIQKAVQKQMKGVDDDEETMSKDLNKTESNISDLKKKASRGGKGGFLSILLNPVKAIATIALGALILIALFRVGWQKWKSAYMPKSDGSKMTILGFEIPNWAGIKAFAIGIKNFFKSGIGNWIDRLKLFFSGIKKKLFGKNGIFKDWASVKHTLRRIVFAYLIGLAKKGLGMIVNAICMVVNFIAPGAGTVAMFIVKLIPSIVTMIATEVMLLWSKH